MGFWDKVKSFFGGAPSGPAAPAPDDALAASVKKAVHARVRARRRFEPVDIAGDVGVATVAEVREVVRVVEVLHEAKWLADIGYSRTWRTDNWIYHPVDEPLEDAGQKPSPRARPAPSPAKPGAAARAPAAPKPAAKPDAYAAPASILGLSAEEHRRRALKIVPWQTAWIGRTDVIPPASDERTALIDRGLVLRGFLTQDELRDIHRVGDLWLRHKDAAVHARVVGKQTADAAIEELRRQKAAVKEKKKREAEAREQARREAVAERRANDIVFLGRGVSSRLGDRRSHVEKLEAAGLPLLSTPADVAGALGVTVAELRWLCFHADASDKPHYVYFEVPKRSGGTRLLSAPQKKLAAAQAWILDHVLARLPVEGPAHGFVRGRSTVTNAASHVARDVVVNLDLSDFFPTISFARVRGLFQRMGYSPAVATVFALLTTEPPRRKIAYDGKPYWVAVGDRGLPQGACTSPALSNLVAKKLDRRLAGVARKMGFAYTRYADDLTFSLPARHRGEIGLLLARVRHVVTEEGFALNPKKGRVQRKGGRQQVTGIVVNERPGVPREEVRRLRAILHAARKTGLEAQNREGRPDFAAHVRGRIAYLHMVDAAKAAPLLAALDALDARPRGEAGPPARP
ncbi:MAG TPA: reverse transcriptase family protein [Minicystis sp.]|nr:reverse transcriptase family protein [Minicystis sp.]